MVTVTLTARTKDVLTITTHNVQFSSTSTSFVDATGYAHSVENNFGHSCLGVLGSTSAAAAPTFSLRLLEGAATITPDKERAQNTIFTANGWWPREQNTQGSTQTVKIQAKTTNATFAVKCNIGTVLYKSDGLQYIDSVFIVDSQGAAIVVDGKVDMASADFRPLPGSVGSLRDVTTVATASGTELLAFGGASESFSSLTEFSPDTIVTGTVDNILNLFRFQAVPVTSGKIVIVYDWTGDKLTLT